MQYKIDWNTINNVTIWDVFMKWKLKAIVVDFEMRVSLLNRSIISYVPIAKLLDWLATNTFEVPYSTVIRWRLK